MKSIQAKFYTALFFILSAITFFSCSDEELNPCSVVTCPSGFACNNGDCVPIDPCAEVTCPEGYGCDEGNCIPESEATITITGEIKENTTWTNNRIYKLKNKVVVQSGYTLTIEAGTIIKGDVGEQSLASALIIAKGAKIEAIGTADQPIVFTSILDNIEVGQTFGTNLGAVDRGLWGGIIILGDAPVSVSGTDTEGQVEGVPADIPNTRYGGTVSNDNSGILKYVSIRHGGIAVSAGSEINGLTLGGVGSETVIDHIEVISNLDDGIECFGGTVNISNAVVAYCGDDALDLDQNYAGTISNVVVVQHGIYGEADEALEFDGPEGSTHKDGKFTLNHATIISTDGIGFAGDLKSKAQGTFNNCSWRGYEGDIKVRTSFDPSDCSEKTDAYTRLMSGELSFNNCEIVNGGDVIKIYSDDDPGEEECYISNYEATYQVNADNMVSEGLSTPVEATTGADVSVFDWTWTKTNDGF